MGKGVFNDGLLLCRLDLIWVFCCRHDRSNAQPLLLPALHFEDAAIQSHCMPLMSISSFTMDALLPDCWGRIVDGWPICAAARSGSSVNCSSNSWKLLSFGCLLRLGQMMKLARTPEKPKGGADATVPDLETLSPVGTDLVADDADCLLEFKNLP
ncbi:hypothetical protein ACLOJK_040537 [Asimina triloba]